MFGREVPSLAGLLQEISGCRTAGVGRAAQPWVPPAAAAQGGWRCWWEPGAALCCQLGMELHQQEPVWRRGLPSPNWEPLHRYHRPLFHCLALLVASHGPPLVLLARASPGFPPGSGVHLAWMELEVPGGGQAQHTFSSSVRQAGRGWSGAGRDGGARPVFADAVITYNMDL